MLCLLLEDKESKALITRILKYNHVPTDRWMATSAKNTSYQVHSGHMIYDQLTRGYHWRVLCQYHDCGSFIRIYPYPVTEEKSFIL